MVSIIVPVYNSEPFLERCLGSLKCQTYTDFEVILINDGSTDGSEVICRKYCDEDSRFKYYYQNNAGCSAARNNGIKHAVGDYIGFCDSDDWTEPGWCEQLYLQTILSRSLLPLKKAVPMSPSEDIGSMTGKKSFTLLPRKNLDR